MTTHPTETRYPGARPLRPPTARYLGLLQQRLDAGCALISAMHHPCLLDTVPHHMARIDLLEAGLGRYGRFLHDLMGLYSLEDERRSAHPSPDWDEPDSPSCSLCAAPVPLVSSVLEVAA